MHYRRVVSQSEAATENNDGESSVEMFDYVIVCCGINKKAKMPFFEGQEKFKGQILHSNQFRDAAHFQDKKVVVIGAGELFTSRPRAGFFELQINEMST